MDQYKIRVLNIEGLSLDMSILAKWIKNQEPGEYEIVVKKINKNDE